MQVFEPIRSVRPTIAALARLSALMARPFDFVHDDHMLDLFPGVAKIKKVSMHTDFDRPLNRAMTKVLNLSQISFGHGFSAELGSDEDVRVALELVLARQSIITDVARYCAAIQLYPQIRSCVLRSQRKQIENALGSDAFYASIREAPTFYRSLPERSRSKQLNDIMAGAVDDFGDEKLSGNASNSTAEFVRPIVFEGMETLMAFVRRANEGLGTMFSLRLPKSANANNRSVSSITVEQASEVKLILRRWRIR